MRITYDNDNLTIYLLRKDFNNIEVREYVKKTILKLKKKITRYISGYYEANVYVNSFYGLIIDLIKKDDFDFFKDFIELDINILENSDVYFKFADYFIMPNKSNIFYYDGNFYVNVKKINKREFLKLTEFARIVYGSELNEIKSKLERITIT